MLHVPKLKIRERTGTYAAGQARIAQILETALDLLVESGYGAVTMREIARRCGIRVGAVSYYYKSRDDLIRDLLEGVITPYVEFFEDIRSNATLTAEQKFAEVVRLVLDDIQSEKTTKAFPELWARANHDPFAAEMVDYIYTRARGVLNELIAELNPALPEAERETLALFISASVEGMTMFVGYEKPWAHRIGWIENIAVHSFLHLVKTLTAEQVRELPLSLR